MTTIKTGTSDQYFIDSVLQGYVPTLPTGEIILTDNPAIGYQDVIGRRRKQFLINTTRAFTKEEVDKLYNTAVNSSATYLVDKSGAYIVDKDDKVLVTDIK